MRQLIVGVMLCLSLVLLEGCRKDFPPRITICIGDGYGGADCVLRDGTKEYWPPSKLRNAWITSQEDMNQFAAWCYDVDQKVAKEQMDKILARAIAP